MNIIAAIIIRMACRRGLGRRVAMLERRLARAETMAFRALYGSPAPRPDGAARFSYHPAEIDPDSRPSLS